MPGPITIALDRCKQGDPQGALDLERELRPFLLDMIRRVRRHVQGPLQARIDSHGIVYEALNSFLTGIAKEEFPALRNREEVCRVLTALIDRTLRDEVRWHRRLKRTPYLEQPLDSPMTQALADAKERGTAAGGMTPDLAAWLEKLLATVRPVHKKAIEIVSLSLEGHSNQEIREALGLGLSTVQEIKRRMYQAWQNTQANEDGHASASG